MLIASLVFLFVFAITALLLIIASSSRAKEVKQTLARLDAIAMEGARPRHDDTLDIRRDQLLSALPWLNRWLYSIEITRRLRLLLSQAALNWTVGRLILMSAALALAVGYLVQLRTRSEILALFLGFGAGCLPIGYVMRKRTQRFARFEELLPEAVDLMVGAIRAGHSLGSAMGLVSKECPEPVRGELRQCFDEQNFGLDLRVALENLVERVPVSDLRMIVTAVLIQQESGGNITEILEKVAHLIRERFRLQRQIRVHTAQGRMTGWVLSLLPIAIGVVMYFVSPDHVSLLWKRDAGIKMLYAGVVMQTIGILVIRKIVRMRF
ncbi:MAG TPA: type II secretion system F family protein [Bryobacteraceae bacterium]|nr:type II secretion system F family protein [Bryobacteraceae bacterium]